MSNQNHFHILGYVAGRTIDADFCSGTANIVADNASNGYIAKYQLDPVSSSASISGPSVVCASEATFTLTNVPPSSAISWSFSPPNLFINSTGTGPTANLAASASASGSATITFYITNSCGISLTPVSLNFWIGEPSISYSPPGQNPCSSSPYYYTTSIAGASYYWSVIDNPNVWIVSMNGYSSVSVISVEPEIFTLSLAVSSGNCNYIVNLPNEISPGLYCQCFYDPWQCGEQGGGMGFAIYPNPASDEINITYEELLNGEDKKIPSEPVHFELTNTNLEKIYKGYMEEPFATIPVKGLPKGIYYLNLFNTKGVIQRKIVINN